MDTHALSEPAQRTRARGARRQRRRGALHATGATPTPVISHAILTYNRGRTRGLADGIVITPSHNPPEDGGIKYNPPNGGPADTDVTGWIEKRANELLGDGQRGRAAHAATSARCSAATTHAHDFITPYVEDLGNVVDMDAIRGAKLSHRRRPAGRRERGATGSPSPSATA